MICIADKAIKNWSKPELVKVKVVNTLKRSQSRNMQPHSDACLGRLSYRAPASDSQARHSLDPFGQHLVSALKTSKHSFAWLSPARTARQPQGVCLLAMLLPRKNEQTFPFRDLAISIDHSRACWNRQNFICCSEPTSPLRSKMFSSQRCCCQVPARLSCCVFITGIGRCVMSCCIALPAATSPNTGMPCWLHSK